MLVVFTLLPIATVAVFTLEVALPIATVTLSLPDRVGH